MEPLWQEIKHSHMNLRFVLFWLCLLVWCLTSRSQILHSYWDDWRWKAAIKKPLKLVRHLYCQSKALNRLPLLWHGNSVFAVSSEFKNRPHLVSLYDKEDYWGPILFCLFAWSFTSHSKNFSFIWRRHHCRWRAACRFWPMLSTHGHWAVRDL